MTWFKVDDGFHASHKLNSIPARHRFQAAGLWVIAGSWAGQQETDGHVPDYMIKAWGATRMTVESLVSAGLWRRERDGYSFCSWLEYNPSKEDTDARRAASAERMRRSRERRRAEATGQEPPPEDVAPQRAEVLRGNGATVLQRPDPTRPDPTRPDPFINTASSSPNGEQGDGKSASQDFHHPPELGPTVRRLLAAGHDPTVVEAAVAAWDARPAPKGPGLLPHLLADAEATIAAEHAEADRRSAAQARMDAVRRCLLCDETGQIVGDDGRPLVPAIPCTHQEDANAELVLAARQRIEAQEAEEAERRALAARAAAEARARWKREPTPNDAQEVPSGPF